jgi:predicted flap endonuclease-1-like 5' DNA nuclease
MSNGSGSLTCALGCWLVAALAGLLAAALLLILGDWTFLQAVFAGGVIFVVAGALISWLICRPLPPAHSLKASPAPRPRAAAAAAAPAPEPKAKAAPKAAAADAPVAGGRKPESLKAARGGKADDLKRIKGIGPKLEKLCNTLGFFHFDQIAAWTADEVAWVDENLEGFKGRVTRDEWVRQAKLLAAGGETEFSKKVDKGDVY